MTKYSKLYFTAFFVFFFVGITYPLNANLLITPLQVVMEERERSSEIVLVNPSDDTNTYTLQWVQLKQTEGTGGYIEETAEERAATTDLEDFTVFSPRQVTLGPNQKQVVRIGVRRPAELAEGEYKSHLKFQVVPDLSKRADIEDRPKDGGTKFGVKVFASYSIPILYRVGAYNATFEIGEPKFKVNEKSGKIILDVPIQRSGTHGAVGQISIYHKPNGGEEKLIAQQGNASVFSEINSRTFNVLTTESRLSSGTIRIQYYKAEGKVSDYKLMAERSFPVQ